jgi:hypothetical protein
MNAVNATAWVAEESPSKSNNRYRSDREVLGHKLPVALTDELTKVFVER